ncbi:MAG: sugar isomerase [Planctomycetota bacterium]|jgi:hypothetical protein
MSIREYQPHKNHPHFGKSITNISRRKFLGGIGGTAMLGGYILGATKEAAAMASKRSLQATELPAGKPLTVKPVLTYQFHERKKKASWRGYGDIQNKDALNAEIKRIEKELKKLTSQAEFPIEILPIALVNSQQQAEQASKTNCDTFLVYPAGGKGKNPTRGSWLEILANTGIPNVMFLRYKTGPLYLWYEIAHWHFLRKGTDTFQVTDMDVDDIVVDDYDDILWRLRALYGLKNAKGTKMLAIGSLSAYNPTANKLGPTHAKEVWDYEFEIVSYDDFAKRLQKVKADKNIMKEVERQTNELISRPNIKLNTDRKFVINSFLALRVCKELMKETGATNLGFDKCMAKPIIEMLDTPPCLILGLANDQGYTAYCHTDFSHTIPGVLMRWIAGRPTFVCNPHFPHHGTLTVAHCAPPRRMNGRDYEPADIMTHYESDYGAAYKVHFSKGQTVTVVIPNFQFTKWFGFRGKILDSPSMPHACRSQIDIAIDGDWQRLLRNMEGFHVQVCYGDYLREVGYALKKIKKIEWVNISENV